MKNESDKKSFFENYFTYRLFKLYVVIIIFIITLVYQKLFN